MKIIILLVVVAILAFLLIEGQHRMIYYPSRYGGKPPLPDRGQTIEYRTGQGKQLAFYLPPAEGVGRLPDRLWLMFGGNASLALDWLDFLNDFPDPAAAFLLIDYPGYGDCQGRPGPDSIMESTEKALATLAKQLEAEPADLEERLMVMGHSLGAAVALLFAESHRVNRIVLVSPFTSLKEMGGRLVGPLLAKTLLHDYDNRTRLKEILNRQPTPPITIIHGTRDKVVPVEMGRELANISRKIIYSEVEDGDHNYILITARAQILQAMLASGKIDQGDRNDDGTRGNRI